MDPLSNQSPDHQITRSSNSPSLQLRLQEPPQLLLRAVQLRLDRAERYPQRLREILVLHALEIMRGDEQPVVRREPRDSFFEPVAELQVCELPIACRRCNARRLVVERDGGPPLFVILRAHVR